MTARERRRERRADLQEDRSAGNGATGRIEVRIGPPTPTGRWLIICPHCPESPPGTVGVNSVNGYAAQWGAMTRAIRHARWHGPRVAQYGFEKFPPLRFGRPLGAHG